MKLNKKLSKKIFSLIITICFVSCIFITQTFAATNNSFDKNSIKLVQKNSKLVEVNATYNGDDLYATFDRKTREVTMQSVEHPKIGNIPIPFGKDKIVNYKVQVHNSKDGIKFAKDVHLAGSKQLLSGTSKFSADIIDTETNKKYTIGSSDKVQAQAFILEPLVDIVGEYLIEDLFAEAEAITYEDTTFVAASTVADQLDNQNQDYYYNAYLDYSAGNVYIGPEITYELAWENVSNGVDVFASGYSAAQYLASDCSWSGYAPIGPENHDQDNPTYYWHFHPNPRTGAHVFFFW
jgi:hypothetical protein